MGKITDIAFFFGDKEIPVYRPGDTVFGKVALTVSGEMSVSSVRFYYYGVTMTKWHTAADGWTTKTEEHLSSKMVPFFGGDGGVHVLTEGTHIFSYRFEIPRDNIPSSFEGDLGAVRYWIRVCVYRSFPARDIEKCQPFTVLADLDISRFTTPVSEKGSKTISKAFGLGNAGELHLSASVDRGAYCPGEKMFIDVTAINQSTKDLGLVRIQLVQSVWFSVKTEQETRVAVVASVVMPEKLGKQDKKVIKHLEVDIPPIPPTTVERSCKILIVKYFVEVVVDAPFRFNLTVKLPVKIGTIPLGAIREDTNGEHPECKSYSRAHFTKNFEYKPCVSGIKKFSRYDTYVPFPSLTYNPLTTVVKPQTTTNPTALADDPSKLAPPDVQRFGDSTIASGGAMAMPSSLDAPPSYDSIFNTAIPPSRLSPSTATNVAQQDKGSPHTASAQSEPKRTPEAAESVAWRGATIGAIFPDTRLQQMKDFVRKNPRKLKANNGKVVGIFEKFQISPPEATSALFAIFDCEENATQWAQHLHQSNPVPELKIFLAVNSSPHSADLENFSLFPHVQISMTHVVPTIDLTEEQSEQLRASSKVLFPSVRLEHGGKSILIASTAKHISGDWRGRRFSLENVGVSISLWPTKESYTAYVKDLKSKPEHENFNEVYYIRNSSIVSATTTVFKMEE